VPVSASAGSVAPMTFRRWVTASSRSSTRASGSHKRDEGAEERALAMHFVERFRALVRQAHHLGLANMKPLGLQVGDDLSRVPGGDRVGLDDG